MKLIYITSKTFPSGKADPIYVRSMARAFSILLGDAFTFVIRGNIPDELAGINTQRVPAPRRARMGFYLVYLPLLIFKNGWNRQDRVFLSYDPYLLAILIFWKRILRMRYRVCSDWHQLFDDWRDQYVAKGSDFLVCTSQRLRALLEKRVGVPEQNILVAYGGVDPEPFRDTAKFRKDELRRKLGLPTDAFLIGYVGGFRSVGMEKGIDTMIRALPGLVHNEIMVFVGGSSVHRAEYASFAESLGVRKRCIFRDRQTFKGVVEHELAMDLLVIPYPDKHHFRDYGFPMKVWEYMASGRPLVYSKLDIIHEVLQGRGSSFTPDDPDDLARVVTSMREDWSVHENIARQNPKDIYRFTWESRAKHIIDWITGNHVRNSRI